MALHFRSPRLLTAEEQAFFQGISGIRYQYALSGPSGDGIVGLQPEGCTPAYCYPDIYQNTLEIVRLETGSAHEAWRFVPAEANTGTSVKWLTSLREEHPRLRSLVERFDERPDGVIEVIPRCEPPERQQLRQAALAKFLDTLAPAIAGLISAVDFTSAYVDGPWPRPGYTEQYLKMLHIGTHDTCSNVAYHEAAHIRSDYVEKFSPEFLHKWRKAAAHPYNHDVNLHGNIQLKAGVTDAFPIDLGRGLITRYAGKSEGEDASELSSYIYIAPELVRDLMGASRIFIDKIELLFEYGFIPKKHRDYLLADGELPPAIPSNCGVPIPRTTIWESAQLACAGSRKGPKTPLYP